jgi:SAM-dependent MidA family methyltransferase
LEPIRSMPSIEFPEPDQTALAHSAELRAHVARLIEGADGWISFRDYMDTVLYAPGLGYYSAGSIKFGEAGDFVTAPEVSPLFAHCVARQFAQVLGALGSGAVVLELGAGSGAFAAQALIALAALEALPNEYLILEVSADLRERQRAHLGAVVPEHLSRVRWLDGLPEQPIKGVVFANEVLDALPVERFRVASEEVQQLGVIQGAAADAVDGLAWASRSDAGTAARVAALGIEFSDGFMSELPDYTPLMRSLSATLSRGALVFVDYGLDRAAYYDPGRREGTLACHYRHRRHDDPFLWPGLNDVTAWVEFTQLAEAGSAVGLEFAGYTTQAQFLIDCGLAEEVAIREEELGDSIVVRTDLARQVRWLTMPDEMGERFKAMAFVKDLDVELSGFSGPDLAHRL